MKLVLCLIASLFLLHSCKNESHPVGYIATDSLNGMTEYEFKEKVRDSLKKSMHHELIEEYLEKSKSSPVLITSSKILRKEYGGSELKLTIKNNSDKTVDAIKFGYSLLNNFGDDLSDTGFGFEWAVSQETIKPHKSIDVSLTLYSNATKVKNPFVSKVHFTDDTKWEAK